MEGSRWLATCVALAVWAAGLPLAAHGAEERDCRARQPPGDTRAEALGTAVDGLPVSRGEPLDGRAYLASMDVSPPRLVTYDLDERRVNRVDEIPTGLRTWAMTTGQGGVWLGSWNVRDGRANLHHYDPDVGRFSDSVRIPSDREFWTLDLAPDGVVLAGTDRPGEVYTYDPGTGDVSSLRFPEDAGAGAVAATDTEVWVGTRPGGAGIHVIDRESGDARTVHPPDQTQAEGVYTMEKSGDRLVAGTYGPARVLVVDTAEGRVLHTVAVPGDDAVDAVEVVDTGTAHITAKPSGTLYRLDLASGELEMLVQPVRDAPTRGLFLHGGATVGVSGAETVWYVDPDGSVASTNLLDAGASGEAVAVMSLAAGGGSAVVGANNRLKAHDVADGAVVRRVFPGEPKDLGSVGDDVYAAAYPYAELHVYRDQQVLTAASWEARLNRPRDLAAAADHVLVGARSDTDGSGALVYYRPGDRSVTTFPDALDGRSVEAVTVDRRTALVGGQGSDATLAALDLRDGSRIWETVPAPGGGDIRGLAVLDGLVHGATSDGTYFAVRVADGGLVHREALLPTPAGDVVANHGYVYLVDRDHLVRVDPVSFAHEQVLDDLDGFLFERPRLARGADCALYVIREDDLVRVRVTG